MGAIYYFNEDKCESEHVKRYVHSFNTPEEAKNTIPDIIRTFSKEDKEYFYSIYANRAKLNNFENIAINYLDDYKEWTYRKQNILKLLLGWYGVDDLIAPEKWYEVIESTDGLFCDLYYMAADYRSKVGDYDLSEKLLKKVFSMCNDKKCNLFPRNREYILRDAEKLTGLLEIYRTKKHIGQRLKNVERWLCVSMIKKEFHMMKTSCATKSKRI